MRKRRVILVYVTCLALPYFSISSQNGKI
jgi:hypothetical protein